MASRVALISSACLAYACMMSRKFPGGRMVHAGSPVQLYPAHIFVADPNMHMGRLEAVLPGVDHEAELPLYRDGRHLTDIPGRRDYPCAVALDQVYHCTTHEGESSCGAEAWNGASQLTVGAGQRRRMPHTIAAWVRPQCRGETSFCRTTCLVVPNAGLTCRATAIRDGR